MNGEEGGKLPYYPLVSATDCKVFFGKFDLIR